MIHTINHLQNKDLLRGHSGSLSPSQSTTNSSLGGVACFSVSETFLDSVLGSRTEGADFLLDSSLVGTTRECEVDATSSGHVNSDIPNSRYCKN